MFDVLWFFALIPFALVGAACVGFGIFLAVYGIYLLVEKIIGGPRK